MRFCAWKVNNVYSFLCRLAGQRAADRPVLLVVSFNSLINQSPHGAVSLQSVSPVQSIYPSRKSVKNVTILAKRQMTEVTAVLDYGFPWSHNENRIFILNIFRLTTDINWRNKRSETSVRDRWELESLWKHFLISVHCTMLMLNACMYACKNWIN